MLFFFPRVSPKHRYKKTQESSNIANKFSQASPNFKLFFIAGADAHNLDYALLAYYAQAGVDERWSSVLATFFQHTTWQP